MLGHKLKKGDDHAGARLRPRPAGRSRPTPRSSTRSGRTCSTTRSTRWTATGRSASAPAASADELVVEIERRRPGRAAPSCRAGSSSRSSPPRRSGKGTGLGLDIVRRIVENHHGQVRVLSNAAGHTVPGPPPDRVRVALVTAAVARGLDDDLPPLTAALVGRRASPTPWSTGTTRGSTGPRSSSWWSGRCGTTRAAARSCWPGPSGWPRSRASPTPPGVLRWNSDKRYLADLDARGRAGGADAPSRRPGEAVGWPDADEVVVKPAVSAGALDTRALPGRPRDEAEAHVARLHADGRTAMVAALPARGRGRARPRRCS